MKVVGMPGSILATTRRFPQAYLVLPLASCAATGYFELGPMNDKSRVQRARILGLGLDNADGHVRITRGENFDIFLGSESTHEQLQDTCIKINEKLSQRGKRLEDLSRDEFVDLIADLKKNQG
jgi:hypothetical protein